jgi:excinuclease ABC subunit C
MAELSRLGAPSLYNGSVLAIACAFSPDQDAEIFSRLPARPAVFLLRGQGEPYASKSSNLRRRVERLLGRPREQSKRLNLRERIAQIEFTPTGSDLESQLLLYQLLRQLFPKTYSARLRLRFASLVKLHLEDPYPRASVTARLERGASGNAYYGPFPSRVAAERFSSDALDFFKMRRCVEDLNPDPAFPGCVYSEMKMCLSPCFKGCSEPEYRQEVARVHSFFDTRGDFLLNQLSRERDRASSELAFEEAALLHAKIEKLKPLLAQLPEIVRRIDLLRAIVVEPSAQSGSVSLFQFLDCRFVGPLEFPIQCGLDAPSIEARLETAIDSLVRPKPASARERMEHLALLKRWYYRTQRTGEIFFADQHGAWPFRRIVRGIGRIYRGEKTGELSSFSATENPASPSSTT